MKIDDVGVLKLPKFGKEVRLKGPRPPVTSTLIWPVESPKHSTSTIGVGLINDIWLGWFRVIFKMVSVQLLLSVTITLYTPSETLLKKSELMIAVSPDQL